MTRSRATCYLLSKICLYVLRLNFASIGLFRLQAVCFIDPSSEFEKIRKQLNQSRHALDCPIDSIASYPWRIQQQTHRVIQKLSWQFAA